MLSGTAGHVAHLITILELALILIQPPDCILLPFCSTIHKAVELSILTKLCVGEYQETADTLLDRGYGADFASLALNLDLDGSI